MRQDTIEKTASQVAKESRSALEDILREGARRMLQEAIEAAITRSDEQHVELKKDMKAEFVEVKALIRNHGRR